MSRNVAASTEPPRMKHQQSAHRLAATLVATTAAVAVLGPLTGCGGSTPQSPASERTPSLPPSPQREEPENGAEAEQVAMERPIDDGRMLWAPPREERVPIAASKLPESAELVLLTKPAEFSGSEAGTRFLEALRLALGDAAPDADAESHTIGVASGDTYGSVSITSTTTPTANTDTLMSPAFEELLATSADSSDAVLLVSLPWIAGEGGGLMQAVWSPLGDTLRGEIDDEWRAAMLSIEAVEDRDAVYWELRLVGGRGVPETRRAKQLARLATAWRDELSEISAEGDFSPHARELLRALPSMLDVLAQHARVGADDRQTVANGYLPAPAAHNLLLAAQLLVAEQSGPPPQTLAAPPSDDETLTERLAKPVTVRFARESLAAAVAIVGESVGAPIIINGRDLQLQGITRNQMVGLDVSEKPASEALVELLLQANPDTEATGPTDRRQQLVFIVDHDAGEIVITTRAAAASRGDELPSVFQP